MSNDLRVALRIQAQSGNTRREIQAINRDMRQVGKDGAKALADGAKSAGDAITQTGREGAASFKIIRQAMRDTAQGQGVWRQGVIGTTAELKELGQVGRQAARETRNELAKAAKEGADPLKQSVDKAEVSLRKMAQTGGTQLRTLRRLAAGVADEFRRIRGLAGTAQGQLAGLGVGVGVVSGLTGSAKLDRQLIRTQQTAGMSVQQREEWRGEQWRLAKTYGIEREQVQTGFDTLIASGLSYDKAKASAGAIAQATAVTGADSGILAKALVTGSSAFDIDLSKPNAAVDILQKMIVAGRLGNAELENLSSIFPKVGGDAKSAGMSMAQALSFVETLSLIELEPDRLGTLAQSTLRMFNNGSYQKNVTKQTGVQFYNKDKSTRNAQDVFLDLQRKYKTLKNDKARGQFIDVVFGKMDQDTQKGIKAFLTGDRLENFAKSTGDINNAKGVIEKDLADNVGSATGVAGRMKATLGEAIDRMSQPLNKSFADFGSYLLDDMKLSGEQMLGAGIATGIGGYYAGRGLKAGGGALLNKFLGGADTLKNIAVGKVLEEATGVTSVFVTNWPAMTGGSIVGDVASAGSIAALESQGATWAKRWLVTRSPHIAGAVTSGSTENTDEGRLRAAENSKLLDAGQRSYYAAFYRNRMSLAQTNPEASDAWVSENAQRLAQEQTGLTAAGTDAVVANDWARRVASSALERPAQGMALLQSTNSARFRSDVAAQVAGQSGEIPSGGLSSQWAATTAQRLTTAGLAPLQPMGTGQAEARLQGLLSKPLVIEIRTDHDAILAEVERRTDIQMRRGQ
nr:phage tail tape measure protein [uncultured Pseudomonas sp.]